eukprot:gnl/TRDRNA2_/TRDRNA2_86128_c0_seq2.p1 gnl/TRDRNA2_/TRDRNA2_86128_c0~~gnl/TRDRNA2_/TRDRNA2_86128_c0_seq2.p1  ORF type:complete len:166 (+),score=25.55 gnl/TRDRNA2_/TRDRNA2_86128_c0_seq2:75-572(+)
MMQIEKKPSHWSTQGAQSDATSKPFNVKGQAVSPTHLSGGTSIVTTSDSLPDMRVASMATTSDSLPDMRVASMATTSDSLPDMHPKPIMTSDSLPTLGGDDCPLSEDEDEEEEDLPVVSRWEKRLPTTESLNTTVTLSRVPTAWNRELAARNDFEPVRQIVRESP